MDTNSAEANAAKSMEGMIGISKRFALLNKLITRDLNNNTNSPTFSLYTKDNITEYLKNPYTYQQQLRRAITYIYGASPHFRRLIQYFTGLSDLAYVVSPYHIDPKTANVRSVGRNYRKVLNAMSAMSVKTQFPKILTVCLREDVFYGTMWVTNDNITIQQLPSDYCAISTIEGNVLNVTFDFSYFDGHSQYLEFYPDEIQSKYKKYQSNRRLRWQELDSPTSFAIKCNNDILDYPLPPFAGILREVYDLEDYRQLKLAKTTLENYAMLVMTIGLNEEGNWQIDLDKAKEFWRNLDSVLPEEIGSVLTPLPIDKIKADQAITFGIVKSIEDAVNRFIQSQSYGKNFKVTFLDCSPFNRKEMGDMYLKACQYGVPMVSYYCASQGLSQSEMDCMNFLENDVLDIKSTFIPLQSSATQSSEGNGSTEDGGAPQKEIDELSPSGEQNREDA